MTNCMASFLFSVIGQTPSHRFLLTLLFLCAPNHQVALCMREHRVLLKCLDLAIEYELNNVLHSVVLQGITSMCEEFDLATTVEDYRALFGSSSSREDSNLVDTILDAYENSDRLKKIRGYQSCYLGHLHIMANAVHDASTKAARIMEAHPAAAELIKQKHEKAGEGGAEEKTLQVALSSLKPPPPASNAEGTAAQQSQAVNTNAFPAAMPPSEYSESALEVASIIVMACAGNSRWRKFVDTRLPEINNRRKCFPSHV